MKLKDAWNWIKGCKPVTRRTADAEIRSLKDQHHGMLRTLRSDHDKDLEKCREQVKEIVERCSNITFQNTYQSRYAVTVEFDSRMMSGYTSRDGLRMIAEMTGRMVEREIATAKFVEAPRI